MAILQKIRLHNFAQHRDLKLSLGAGITTIVGPMGSGKTNAMLAVPMSLCSDYSMFPGVKASLIKRGSEKASFCQTTWELPDGTTVEINRFLRGGESYVVVNGERSDLRREGDITRFCENLLGYDAKTLLDQHYIAQSKVDGIINEQPTDRIKAMAALFGVQDLLIPSSKELVEEANWIRGKLYAVDQAGTDELLRDKHAVVVAFAALLDREYAVLKTMPSDEEVAEAKEIIRKVEEREQLKRNRQTITGTLARKTESLAAGHQAQVMVEVKVKELKEKQKQVSAYREQQQSKKWLTAEVLQVEDQIATFSRQAADIEAWLLNEPKKPELPRVAAGQLDLLTEELNEVNRHLKLVADGKPVCSNCGAKITVDMRSGPILRTQQSGLLATRQQLQSQQAAWLEYDRLSAEYQKLADGYRTRLIQVVDTSKNLRSKKVKLDADLAAIVIPDNLPSSEKVDEVVAAAEAKLKSIIETVAQHQAWVDTQTAELDKIRDQLKEITHKWESSLEKSVSLVESRRVCQQQLTDIRNQKIRARTTRKMFKQQLAVAKDREAEAAHLSKWLQHVELATAAIKPKAMPRAVLASMMQDVVMPMTAICNYMHLPFSISYDQNLELTAIHHDGAEEPARCLSGGQRSCVALAFWFSKIINMKDGLKLLFVDEPAAALDEEGVASFADLLFELSSLAKKNGCQIVLTTHHRQLQKCAQHCLSLYEVVK